MNILIIGSSAAGISAASVIREQNKDCSIRIVCEEDRLPYYRYRILECLLDGKKCSELYFKNNDFFKSNNIELILNKTAVGLDTRRKRVKLNDDTYLGFDKLLIATGASFKLPEIKGANKKNVISLRKMSDIEAFQNSQAIAKSIFLVGEDLFLSKLALRFVSADTEIFLLTKNSEILSVLSETEKIRFIKDDAIVEIIGEGEVQAVKLASGKVFACSLLVFTGLCEPNFKFVKDSPIEIDAGILVDEFMATSVPGIFAAGDVARIKNEPSFNFSWQRAESQGHIAGVNMIKE